MKATLQSNLKYPEDRIASAFFSPDKKLMISCVHDKDPAIYSVATRELVSVLKGHPAFDKTAEFSSDSTKVVTLTLKGDGIRLWDVKTGRLDWSTELPGSGYPLSYASFSPDGSRIVVTRFGPDVFMLDARTGAQLWHGFFDEEMFVDASFSPDGKHVAVSASCADAVFILSADDGKKTMELEGRLHSVFAARYSHDGSKIVVTNRFAAGGVWDSATGKKLLGLQNFEKFMDQAVFSPDDSKIVSGGGIGHIYVWDAATGEELLRLGTDTVYLKAADFAADGKSIISVYRDGSGPVWKLIEPEPQAVPDASRKRASEAAVPELRRSPRNHADNKKIKVSY